MPCSASESHPPFQWAITADVAGSGPDLLAYLWAVGLGALMLVRRRYPVLVVVLSVIGLFAYYAADYPPIGVAVPVAAAVFSAAELGRLVPAILGSLVVFVVSTSYRLLAGQDPSFVLGYELVGHVLLLATAIALGDSLRSRREAHDRAGEVAALLAERYRRQTDARVTAERLAISRDLHDSLGHAITVVSLHDEGAAGHVQRRAPGRTNQRKEVGSRSPTRHSVAGRTGSIQYLSPHVDQESRSAGQRTAPSVTAMEVSDTQPAHGISSGSPDATVTGVDGNVLELLQDR